MKLIKCYIILILLIFMNGVTMSSENPKLNPLSFADFDKRAKAGETLNVVFLGGSLTWGANASDPNQTSYRALMGKYLQKKYPKAHIRLYDAAIGGTGSDLGLFRLERDVLRHSPDLVFVEYTVNDGCNHDTIDKGETYETIIRMLLARGIPIELVMLGGKFNYSPSNELTESKRRLQHLKIAEYYGTAVGDTYPYIRRLVKDGEIDLDEMYCFEATHPDDLGYKLFYDAVKEGFEDAIKSNQACRLPEKTFFTGKYSNPTRLELSKVKLPVGWKVDKTYRISLWFDGLSSRWMDNVVSCDIKDKDIIQPLKLKFKGSMLGIFGEASSDGLGFKLKIDGKSVLYKDNSEVWPYDTKRFGFNNGNLFKWECVSMNLEDKEHILKLIPVFPKDAKTGKLKINSICFAGK